MHKSIISGPLAGTAALSGCTTYGKHPPVADAAMGAAFGAVGGTAFGAIVPGASIAKGAVAGAAVGGLAGALWADRNDQGYADGCVQNGQCRAGTLQGYDPTLRRVATGAVGGAVLGAAAGAAIPGVSVPGGATIRAAVDRLAGAVWADNVGDGQADAYVYNGQYYAGAPQGYQQALPAPAPAPVYAFPVRGERG